MTTLALEQRKARDAGQSGARARGRESRALLAFPSTRRDDDRQANKSVLKNLQKMQKLYIT